MSNKPEDKEETKFEEKKRSNRGRNRRRSKGYTPREKGKGSNDLSWHIKSDQMLVDAASVPWSWATGKRILRKNLYNSSYNSWYAMPGLCSIRVASIPGAGSAGSDPLNLAAQAIYTDIRRELKSANQYEGSDVVIYLLGVSEIMALISFATRAYGTLMEYSYSNTFTPLKMLHMQGINGEDLIRNPADFRARLNIAIAKASQIWIPKGFDFITRQRWLYSNYYTEGTSIKDQIYFFTPTLFRKFTLDEVSDYKGHLIPSLVVPDPSTNPELLLTGDDIIDALNEMIDALVGDSDFQNIAGDLFNRYGAGGVETFTLVPENMIITPVFSIEVLEQMQNARCLNAVHDLAADLFADQTTQKYLDAVKFFTVTQDETLNRLIVPNKIVVSDADTTGAGRRKVMGATDPIISIHDAPSPAKTMLVTRLTNIIYDWQIVTVPGGRSGVELALDASAEWVTSIDYGLIDVTIPDQISNLRVVRTAEITYMPTGQGDDAVNKWFDFLCALSAFHYHPMVWLNNSAQNALEPYAMGSQDIVAPILSEQIRDMNRVDLLSLFAVPDVGKVVGK